MSVPMLKRTAEGLRQRLLSPKAVRGSGNNSSVSEYSRMKGLCFGEQRPFFIAQMKALSVSAGIKTLVESINTCAVPSRG